VLLQPLPYPEPSRIVDVNEYARGRASAVSPPNGRDWRAGNATLEALTFYTEQVVTLGGNSEPSRVFAGMVDAQFGTVMRVAPLVGRGVDADAMRPSARKVAILGHALWQRAFGGDASIVGRQITLEGEAYEVVGVMPAGFDFPDSSDAWVPLQLDDHNLGDNQ